MSTFENTQSSHQQQFLPFRQTHALAHALIHSHIHLVIFFIIFFCLLIFLHISHTNEKFNTLLLLLYPLLFFLLRKYRIDWLFYNARAHWWAIDGVIFIIIVMFNMIQQSIKGNTTIFECVFVFTKHRCTMSDWIVDAIFVAASWTARIDRHPQ